MAARRGRRKARRRRSPRTFKLLNAAEAFLTFNVITREFSNTNPVTFLFGEFLPGITSDDGTSLAEIARDPETRLKIVGARLMDPQRILNATIKTAALSVGFKIVKRALRKPISLMNRTIKPLGLGVSF